MKIEVGALKVNYEYLHCYSNNANDKMLSTTESYL